MSVINRDLTDEQWAMAFVALHRDEVVRDVVAKISPDDRTNRNPNVTFEIYRRELLERIKGYNAPTEEKQ